MEEKLHGNGHRGRERSYRSEARSYDVPFREERSFNNGQGCDRVAFRGDEQLFNNGQGYHEMAFTGGERSFDKGHSGQNMSNRDQVRRGMSTTDRYVQ